MNAETDTQVAPLGKHFSALGKTVFALCDKQEAATEAEIRAAVAHPFLSEEHGFEDVLLNQTNESALRRYALDLVASGQWPSHLAKSQPTISMALTALRDALRGYLSWSKGAGGAAELLHQCSLDEMPTFVIETLLAIQSVVIPSTTEASSAAAGQSSASN